MDYKKHTIERYKEKFLSEISEEDYNKLKEIVSIENAIKLKKKRYKTILFYKERYMTIIFNDKKTIITTYPARRTKVKEFKQNYIIIE
jgi:hypothetical protein